MTVNSEGQCPRLALRITASGIDSEADATRVIWNEMKIARPDFKGLSENSINGATSMSSGGSDDPTSPSASTGTVSAIVGAQALENGSDDFPESHPNRHA